MSVKSVTPKLGTLKGIGGRTDGYIQFFGLGRHNRPTPAGRMCRVTLAGPNFVLIDAATGDAVATFGTASRIFGIAMPAGSVPVAAPVAAKPAPVAKAKPAKAKPEPSGLAAVLADIDARTAPVAKPAPVAKAKAKPAKPVAIASADVPATMAAIIAELSGDAAEIVAKPEPAKAKPEPSGLADPATRTAAIADAFAKVTSAKEAKRMAGQLGVTAVPADVWTRVCESDAAKRAAKAIAHAFVKPAKAKPAAKPAPADDAAKPAKAKAVRVTAGRKWARWLGRVDAGLAFVTDGLTTADLAEYIDVCDYYVSGMSVADAVAAIDPWAAKPAPAAKAKPAKAKPVAKPVAAPAGRSPLTISHTPADGSIIVGTSRGDGTRDVLIGHGWRFSGLIGAAGAWYIRGSRSKPADVARIDATATALRAEGWPVTVSVDSSAPVAAKPATVAAPVTVRHVPATVAAKAKAKPAPVASPDPRFVAMAEPAAKPVAAHAGIVAELAAVNPELAVAVAAVLAAKAKPAPVAKAKPAAKPAPAAKAKPAAKPAPAEAERVIARDGTAGIAYGIPAGRHVRATAKAIRQSLYAAGIAWRSAYVDRDASTFVITAADNATWPAIHATVTAVLAA